MNLLRELLLFLSDHEMIPYYLQKTFFFMATKARKQ